MTQWTQVTQTNSSRAPKLTEDETIKHNKWLIRLCENLRERLGFVRERRVDIQLLELVVQPGDNFLMGWDVERDLRMRSGSPREAEEGSPWEPNGELLYEWKTGSLLGPDGNPWHNEGFTLHLTVIYPTHTPSGASNQAE